MGYKAVDVVKLHLATTEAKSIDAGNLKINSFGLVSATIVSFLSRRSYWMHLAISLLEAFGSNAFIQTSEMMATGYIKWWNNTKSLATMGINCCEEDDFNEVITCELSDNDLLVSYFSRSIEV